MPIETEPVVRLCKLREGIHPAIPIRIEVIPISLLTRILKGTILITSR